MGHFDNRSILFLHGYDSSSQGDKANLLRQLYPRNRLLIPDLPLDPQACLNLAEDTLKTASNDTILIGASLGGFYAYYLAAKYKRDVLLINPVYHPSQEAKKLLETETNPDKKKLVLHAANIYLTLESNLKNFTPPPSCFVALGENDDVIDPNASAKHFYNASVTIYPDDHRMVQSFSQLMQDFEALLEKTF